MFVIIPLGGIGKRFSELGYLDPKPLIRVHGKELILWLIDSLKLKKNDKVFIVYNKILENYNFENKISLLNNNINFLKLSKQTKGPAETVHNLIKILDKENNSEKVLLIDGDVFYNFDILSKVRTEKYSSIFYFTSKEKKPIYSYIKIKNNKIIDIKEKSKISNNANVGAYFFSSISILNKYLEKGLKFYSNKAYISEVYKLMIQDRIKVKALKISNKSFEILGTPQQIKSFAINNQSLKKNFGFDFESLFTIIKGSKYITENYIPNEKNIKFLKFLYKKRNNIIIICNLNNLKLFQYGQTTSNFKNNIKKILIKNKIYYNKIQFFNDKIDFFIDHKAINSVENLNVKLGYYEDDYTSRSFNNVFVGENITTKKSINLKKLKNEVQFYKKIPLSINSLFPTLIEEGLDYYKIDTIKGLTFTYLYTNELLQNSDIKKLLSNLEKIHKSKKCKQNNKDINNMYNNYSKKFLLRLKELDNSILKKNKNFFDYINLKLIEYEKNKMGSQSVIHGDPVFSNIFIEYSGKIKFIDPRGSLLDKFSIYGDRFYDYGKIYQSLTGFEYITRMKEHHEDFFKSKKEFFEIYFINKFGKRMFKYLKIITSSFYISLIPLQDPRHKYKFLNVSKKLIS